MKAVVLVHAESEGPGTLGDFLKDHGIALDTLRLYRRDRLPPSIEGIGAVVTMGGPMNVYEEDKYPFLRHEVTFLKEAIDADIPVIGICLGAQMIAKTLGARVYKARKKEIGWYEVTLTEEGKGDVLFKGLSGKLRVFQWHKDTFSLATGSVLLATSGTCPNQAFRYRNAYGLQFHVEVTRDILRDWFEDSDQKEEILARYDAIKEEFTMKARKIYQGFLQLFPTRI